MALAELIGKLRTKKHSAERSAFSEYLTLVRVLANGGEADSDEADHILKAAGRSESTFEHDVELQQQRNTWHSQRQQHWQSIEDRRAAENELQAVTDELNLVLAKLQPKIDEARSKIQTAEHTRNVTAHAEARLTAEENILDRELLEREQSITERLRPIWQELEPLLADRRHRESSLSADEQALTSLIRIESDHTQFSTLTSFFSKSASRNNLESSIDDLKNQVDQLDELIIPRQRVQQRLQNELNEIRQQKLQP